MRDLTALRDRFLEWLYEMAMGSTDTFVPAQQFFNDEAINCPEDLQLARAWASEGLINNGSGLAGVSAALTHQGIEHVQALRRRRADPALRRAAAIDGLLRWLYKVDPDGDGWTDVEAFLASPWSWFVGVQLSRAQVDRAAEYLKNNKLIDGSVVGEYRGPVNAQITTAGQECRRRRQRSATPSSHGPRSDRTGRTPDRRDHHVERWTPERRVRQRADEARELRSHSDAPAPDVQLGLLPGQPDTGWGCGVACLEDTAPELEDDGTGDMQAVAARFRSTRGLQRLVRG